MKEIPILFSAPMVRAILEGRKTQTRRVVNPQPFCADHGIFHIGGRNWQAAAIDGMGRRASSGTSDEWRCPYGAAGDRLWVRETFAVGEYARPESKLGFLASATIPKERSENTRLLYAASETEVWVPPLPWRPSIHLPRWASRLMLDVVCVRVERVQEISRDECRLEGCGTQDVPWCASGRTVHPWVDTYARLWDAINAKRGFGWDSNPWVWVVEFRRAA